MGDLNPLDLDWFIEEINFERGLPWMLSQLEN